MQNKVIDESALRKTILDDASSFLVSPRFLRSRLLVYAAVRFCVVAAIFAGTWFAPVVVGIEGLPVRALQILAGVLFVYNVLVAAFVYRYPREPVSSHQYLVGLMHVTVSLDFVFLTVALWFVGGAASPFASFYVIHIILAAMLMPRLEASCQALFGYALFAGLVLSQLYEFAPAYAPAGAVPDGASMDWRFAATLLTVQGILFTVATWLVSEFAAALNRGEHSLSELIAELRQLSETRRDFLQLVTHNLKAPAAAVTMLLDSAESLWPDNVPETAHNAITRARVRTRELSKLLQDLQQLSALESGGLHEQEEYVDLNELARELADGYGDLAARKHQNIEVDADETLREIRAVPRLILEAAVNYVTNAIKYTPEGGRIILRTRNATEEAVFEVEDTGIGIAEEHLDTLFGEFVRVPAAVSGERPPGIGLGLSIVRRIMQYYGGRVYVSSSPGKGSVFGFALPLPRAHTTKVSETQARALPLSGIIPGTDL